MSTFSRPVFCPILVGREASLEALDHALSQVQGGSGSTILVSGEAGIGKSRLVSEVARHAEQCGFVVLQGCCFESDRGLPYGPILDLLRSLVASLPLDERTPAPVIRREGATLLPREVAALLPNLDLATHLAPDEQRRHLFESVERRLTDRAAGTPLLVVVEDLHWADEASLELLLCLARNASNHSMLLLLTYRGDEVHPVLRHFLAGLDRERLAAEVVVAPLSPNELDAMLRAILDLEYPIDAEFLNALHALTAGNPFFVEEILASLGFDDREKASGLAAQLGRLRDVRVPRTVEDTVQRRLERLSDAARETLTTAAAIGQRFDFVLLRAVVNCVESELLRQIKELVSTQFLVEESDSWFTFRHALTRQAVYAQFLGLERKILHQKLGEVMERVYADTLDAYVAALARHYYEAGAWTKVVEYGMRAGEQAQSLHAPRVAVEHLTQAIDAAHRLGSPAPPAAHHTRGLAYVMLGDFDGARDDLEIVLALAEAAGEQEAEWRALLDLGLLWSTRDYEKTGDYFAQSLALAREMNTPEAIARSLNRVGNWHANLEQPFIARDHHLEALGIVRGAADRRGTAETLDLLGAAHFLAGDLSQATEHWRAGAELFRELDDRQSLASCLAALVLRGTTYPTDTVIADALDVAGPLHDGEEALRIAREIGWRAGQANALVQNGACLATQGQYTGALEMTAAAQEIARAVDHRPWLTVGHCVTGLIHLDLFALPVAREHLERAYALAEEFGSLYLLRVASAFLARVCSAQGDVARAGQLLASINLRPEPPYTLAERIVWSARAEVALATRYPGAALEILDRLIACVPNGNQTTIIPRLLKLRGDALLALGRLDEAQAALVDGVREADLQGLRPLAWRIRATLAVLHGSQRRDEDAEREGSAARALIEALVPDIPTGPLRDEFLYRAHMLIPRSRPLTSLQAAKRQFGGLTAREREVAILLARGLTNREIAADLTISEETVRVHAKRILAKLDFRSRAQVGAWAAQRGLL